MDLEFIILLMKLSYIYNFTSNERKITSETEAKMTSIAVYSDYTIIALVKRYLYVFDHEGNFLLEQDLSDILSRGEYFVLIAREKNGNSYDYFIIFSILNEDEDAESFLAIKYCAFSTSESIINPLNEFNKYAMDSNDGLTFIIKDTLSCELMTILDESLQLTEYLACFALVIEGAGGTSLGVIIHKLIFTDEVLDLKLPYMGVLIQGVQTSAIKSVHRAGENDVIICYINNNDNSGNCVNYEIQSHQFRNESPNLSSCKTALNGMEAYYFDDISSYMVICSDSSTPKRFHALYLYQNSSSIIDYEHSGT